MVIAGHLNSANPWTSLEPNVDRVIYNGPLGVRVFFVISGFLITYLLLAEEAATGAISLQNFYIRRTLRIWPVYFTFLIFLSVLTTAGIASLSTCQTASIVTFTVNMGCTGPLFSHLWSLGVEEQFYLLWPLLFILLPRRRGLIITTLIALPVLIRAAVYLLRIGDPTFGDGKWFYLYFHCDALMVGCACACLQAKMQESRLAWRGVTVWQAIQWRPSWGRFIALSVLILVSVSVNFTAVPQYARNVFALVLGPTLQAIAIGYLVMSYVNVPRGASAAVLQTRAFSFIGMLSYRLYMWHMPFVVGPSFYPAVANPWFTQLPANVAVLACVAIASFYLLEQPIARLRRYFR